PASGARTSGAGAPSVEGPVAASAFGSVDVVASARTAASSPDGPPSSSPTSIRDEAPEQATTPPTATTPARSPRTRATPLRPDFFTLRTLAHFRDGQNDGSHCRFTPRPAPF